MSGGWWPLIIAVFYMTRCHILIKVQGGINGYFLLHKRFSQSLRVSPENPFDWKFLKIDSVKAQSFEKRPQFTSMSAHTCLSHSSDYHGRVFI